MILITNKDCSGINFFYPVFQRGRPLRIVPWVIYRKWLPFRAGTNVLLFVIGIALLDAHVRTEGRYGMFAALVLISTFGRLWFFMPRGTISITSTTTTKLVPLAALDYSGTFIVAGLPPLILAGEGGDLVATLISLSLVFEIYGLITLMPAIAFLLGVGRRTAH